MWGVSHLANTPDQHSSEHVSLVFLQSFHLGLPCLQFKCINICIVYYLETSLTHPAAKTTWGTDDHVDPVHFMATVACLICIWTNLPLFLGRNGRKRELVRSTWFRDGLKTRIAHAWPRGFNHLSVEVGCSTPPHTKCLLHVAPGAQTQHWSQQLLLTSYPK